MVNRTTFEVADLDCVYGPLADPSRRRMLEQLRTGPHSVSQLAEPLSITLPAVVKHLAVLERSGLVSSTKRGRVRECRLEAAALEDAEAWIARQRTFWSARLDALAEHVAGRRDEHHDRRHDRRHDPEEDA